MKEKLSLIISARELRKKETPTEKVLWKVLNNYGLCKYKFRRQHPIKGFIVDFYCPKTKLAIEIDGKIHDNQKEADTERQTKLESFGLVFLRFSNDQVTKNLDDVLRAIKRTQDMLRQKPIKNEVTPLHSVERGAESASADEAG